MNIDEYQVGDYVETSDGFVREVVAKEDGYVALKDQDGNTFWVTHNKIVAVRNKS